MAEFKIVKESSSFYGAASYVENDVRNSTRDRNELKYGHYQGSPTYPGDWTVDFEYNKLRFAFRGAFNRRMTQMKGAYPEYHNDVNMDVAVVPLDKIGEFRGELAKLGVKVTPYVESVIEQCTGFAAGEFDAKYLGMSRESRMQKIAEDMEKLAAAREQAVIENTNLQAPLKVGGALKLKR
ncbi:MAG: hypothetical protein ACAH80_16410 [Alphaproteobacteria bacterium]